MADLSVNTIIDHLWSWIRTAKDHDAIKDTTKIFSAKYDCYIDSSVSDPVSLSVFELSDKGELMINNAEKVLESTAAFFLFVNKKSGWMVWVKNTPDNQKKLIKGEALQNLKVRVIL